MAIGSEQMGFEGLHDLCLYHVVGLEMATNLCCAVLLLTRTGLLQGYHLRLAMDEGVITCLETIIMDISGASIWLWALNTWMLKR